MSRDENSDRWTVANRPPTRSAKRERPAAQAQAIRAPLRLLALVAGLVVLAASLSPRIAFAGDSLYGKVTEVKRADLLTIDNGIEKVEVRIVGIEVPKEGRGAEDAKKFVSDLVLGKNARLRLEYRARNKELVGRVQTDDPEIGIKDVGLELARAGMARRQRTYDYKYRELSAAENEAKKAKRGLWAAPRPK